MILEWDSSESQGEPGDFATASVEVEVAEFQIEHRILLHAYVPPCSLQVLTSK